MMELSDELKHRGLINDMTSPQLEERLNNGGLTLYTGTDPTDDSPHIGHHFPLLYVKRLKEHGYHLTILAGGATGFIGDPKISSEHNMLTKGAPEHNYQCPNKQVEALFGFKMVNNLDQTKDIFVTDLLRDYGKYSNVGYIISKETVKHRLDIGINYMELSYMILQVLNFLHLYEDRGRTLQLGGQDRQGNTIGSLELIHKGHGADTECYGLMTSLTTKAGDTKSRESGSGTIRLGKYKTSAYEMYQSLVNPEDEKIIDYLKKLAFPNKEEIDALEEKVKIRSHLREAQKTLAKEVVTFLHGEEEYNKALKITSTLFKGNIKELDAGELQDALKGFKAVETANELTPTDILIQTGTVSSRREAREWINQGSTQTSEDKVKGMEFIVPSKNAILKGRTLIKKGKRNYLAISQKQSREERIANCSMKNLSQSAFFVKP